jgi:hypothetical protein
MRPNSTAATGLSGLAQPGPHHDVHHADVRGTGQREQQAALPGPETAVFGC